MATTISDGTAQRAAAQFTDEALTASTVLTRTGTTLAIVTDDTNGVWAFVIPNTMPGDRYGWLQTCGIDPDDLYPTKSYAFGYYTADGRLIREGSDENLKGLVEHAIGIHTETGEEMFPLDGLRQR